MICNRYRPSPAPHRRGITIFELIAVLGVIGIVLTLVAGNYNTWGTAHAISNATTIVEQGLRQARTLATTRRAYVAFNYGTEVGLAPHATGFELISCTTGDEQINIESQLQSLARNSTGADLRADQANLEFTAIGSLQRLPGHVRLGYISEENLLIDRDTTPSDVLAPDSAITLFFRPDGSAMILGDATDQQTHTILLYTRAKFHRGNRHAAPLYRLVRLDLTTGIATQINPNENHKP